MRNFLIKFDEVVKTSVKDAFKRVGEHGSIISDDDCISKRIIDRVICCEKKNATTKARRANHKPTSIQISCFVLVKIGKKEHMERLLKYGEVYMNSTKFFRDHENAEIGDTYEGALYIEYARVAKYRKKINNEKLYCMWHINSMFPLHQDIIHSNVYDETTGKRTVSLDFRNLSGFTPGEDSYMVVIHNVKKFNERFNEACKKAKADFIKHGVVTYYDEYDINPDKRLSPFHKRKRYEKQQEIRYLAYKDTNKALTLKLGSLEDIAGIYNVNEVCLNIIDDCRMTA